MYTRKTKDIFYLLGYYYGSWEVLTAEISRNEIKERLKEYKENEPFTPYKIEKRREKIAL